MGMKPGGSEEPDPSREKLVAGAGIEPAQSPVYETGAFPFGDPAV